VVFTENSVREDQMFSKSPAKGGNGSAIESIFEAHMHIIIEQTGQLEKKEDSDINGEI
jgi:hypothetical protein